MNGAESLLKTLANCDVDVCFINPGTSEMHFVAALDEVDGIRCVLGLFEGVVAGAADGYARMARKPAATLTHLGPGFANSLAHVHNAKRGNIPMVNIIGQHATYHLELDAPLTTDIHSIASPVSHWVYSSESPEAIAKDTAKAVQEAGHNKIATLMLPTDVSWGDNPNGPVESVEIPPLSKVSESDITKAAELLAHGDETMVLLGGPYIDTDMGITLSKIAKATGARICTETFTVRMERGEGTAKIDRMPYRAENAVQVMSGVKHLILVGAKAPVAFFAYPGMSSVLTPEDCEVLNLATVDHDTKTCLNDLMLAVNAQEAEANIATRAVPAMPSGDLNTRTWTEVFANRMPENTIVVDDSSASGAFAFPLTQSAAPHDWTMLTGGVIGYGLAASVGAAVACPDRKVVCLQSDGGAMYSIQALWTMARENLDVTVIILNNQKYNVLEAEFALTGARGGKPSPKAASVLDIGSPNMNFVDMATGMGVKATRATTVEEFDEQLQAALDTQGPCLVEAMIPAREFKVK
ncbi:acetolactate synthase large subunit [Maricurvus nonylphenolicus]|uniref:acetolactate synthase large subunit n=1 Tax=Maricurvus nonylphenolicus TaxID=1008307 RepID=UPI0036F413A3